MAKKSVDKMTKAELVREVKKLQKQYDKLLNRKGPETMPFDVAQIEQSNPAPLFPWQKALPNAFDGAR